MLHTSETLQNCNNRDLFIYLFILDNNLTRKEQFKF